MKTYKLGSSCFSCKASARLLVSRHILQIFFRSRLLLTGTSTAVQLWLLALRNIGNIGYPFVCSILNIFKLLALRLIPIYAFVLAIYKNLIGLLLMRVSSCSVSSVLSIFGDSPLIFGQKALCRGDFLQIWLDHTTSLNHPPHRGFIDIVLLVRFTSASFQTLQQMLSNCNVKLQLWMLLTSQIKMSVLEFCSSVYATRALHYYSLVDFFRFSPPTLWFSLPLALTYTSRRSRRL